MPSQQRAPGSAARCPGFTKAETPNLTFPHALEECVRPGCPRRVTRPRESRPRRCPSASGVKPCGGAAASKGTHHSLLTIEGGYGGERQLGQGQPEC